jgi:energy-coupling factor transporter ATP-binding protein EcfA2/energy-coupling factor transporter transmembrane protein EcfT
MSEVVRGGVQVTNLTWTPFASSEPLLRDITFSIEAGERVLLVGPSGSGKSTLLRAIAGVLSDSEAGELSGEILAGPAGLLLQDPNDSIVADTIYREVSFGLENLGREPKSMPAIVRAQLDSVSLEKSLSNRSTDLSGGEMQRMALAGVMAMEPSVLLLDEPTSMLDTESANSVRAAVEAQIKKAHSTLIVVEHHFESWLSFVDRVLVLNAKGQLVFDGSSGELLKSRTDELASLGLWVPGMTSPIPIRIQLDERSQGRLTVLTGRSGAGKTTELLHRLRKDPLGKTILTGVGYLPQQAELTIIGGTVFESVHLTANLAAKGLGIDPAEAIEHTRMLMGALGIAALSDKNPYEISGGEQRRVAMATALAHWPMAIYLDEPTVGQDRDSWAAIVGAIISARDSGIKVTLATHDPVLISMADEVVEIAPEVTPKTIERAELVSGLIIFLAPLLLLLGSTLVANLQLGLVAGLSTIVAMGLIGLGGFKVTRPTVLIPGLIGVASIGLSNWYLSPGLHPETGLVAALRVSMFIVPGILLAAHLHSIPLGDQLGQVLHMPARPVVAAAAAMQRMNNLLALWGELRFIHSIRGLGVGRNPVARAKEYSRLIFAMLLQAIRDAGTTSVAMDARGFSAPAISESGKRTWAEAPKRGKLDRLVLGLAIAVVAVIWLAK